MQPASLCYGCMQENEAETSCPHCGWENESGANPAHSLAPGSILNQRYITGRVIEQDSIGITYIARDQSLDQRRAIKEYFPEGVAIRNEGSSEVSAPGDEGLQEKYLSGLIFFMEEARTWAAAFGQTGAEAVFDCFEANDTAYRVMEFPDLHPDDGELPGDPAPEEEPPVSSPESAEDSRSDFSPPDENISLADETSCLPSSQKSRALPSPAVLIIVFLVIAVGLAALISMQAAGNFSSPAASPGRGQTPEALVTGFWSAYFSKDYETAVTDLSVSFLVQATPDKMSLNHSELVGMRPELEKRAAPVIQKMRAGYADPADPRVIILGQYTQEGDLGAVVFFKILDGQEILATQSALLILESGELKILDFNDVDEQWLAQTSGEDLKQLFAGYESVLKEINNTASPSP